MVEKTSGDHLVRAAKRPLFISAPETQLAFDGQIDKVRVYSESLNADQIQRIMASGACASPTKSMFDHVSNGTAVLG